MIGLINSAPPRLELMFPEIGGAIILGEFMPYFIREDAPGCDGWAVVKTDGSEVACQETKAMAIKQMVALSLAEGIEPGGDWSDRKD